MAPTIRVPVSVLSTWRGVEVEDGVNAILRAEVNDTIEMLEPGFLEHSRVHVICMRLNSS